MDSIAEELRKIPPQQLEAEQSLLGGILIESDSLPSALEVLNGEEFYREAHRIIFRAMQDLFERSEPVDLITVANLLMERNHLDAVGGAAYLASLTEVVPSAANVSAYARIVNEKAILRRLIQTSNEIISWCYGAGKSIEEILDYAEKSIFTVTENRIRTSYSPIKDVVKKSIKAI